MTDTILVTFFSVDVVIVIAKRIGWSTSKGGYPITSLTAFHDFQARDKQKVIEYVIEKAGKKMKEQKGGQGKDIKDSVKGGDKDG